MDLVKFTDVNGQRRQLTLRSLPGGVVQAIEGALNATPGVSRIDVHLHDAEGRTVTELTFDLSGLAKVRQ